MTSQTIARRYAKALLTLGQEDGNFAQYGQELTDVATLMADPNLAGALTNPIYPAESRRGILEKLLAKLGPSKIIQNFLLLLQDKGRISQLQDISRHYQRLVDEVNQIRRATIITAGPISQSVQDQVRSTLEQMTNMTVFLEARQDSSIIGGIVAQVGDLTLDGSVKTQLKNLKESLIKG